MKQKLLSLAQIKIEDELRRRDRASVGELHQPLDTSLLLQVGVYKNCSRQAKNASNKMSSSLN